MNAAQKSYKVKIILIQFVISALFIWYFGCDTSKKSENEIFWSDENSPENIGRMLIDDLLNRPELMMYVTDFWTGVHYAEACAGFGAIRLAALLKDPEIITKLTDRYVRVQKDSLVKDAQHVDANVYGILPLELYMQTGEKKYLVQGLELADGQWENPLPNGLTNQTRYWIDDVWMIGSLQVQAYRATGKKIYLHRAAKEISAYVEKLQQPNGLFYHGENAPFYWGRGNGWVAAGLADLLTELPEDHPQYAPIVKGYAKMMVALLEYQAEDGMWRQLIDKRESWKETSSTAMFGYAITIGVKKEILSRTSFVPAYQKAWKSLINYIDKQGKVTQVCVGTGKSDDIEYYLNRPRTTGDLHGQAPVFWFAYSLLTRPDN
jgi:unsaturated rhamnogalacturonyl hydrolase